MEKKKNANVHTKLTECDLHHSGVVTVTDIYQRFEPKSMPSGGLMQGHLGQRSGSPLDRQSPLMDVFKCFKQLQKFTKETFENTFKYLKNIRPT
jgi:hypothetical protein